MAEVSVRLALVLDENPRSLKTLAVRTDESSQSLSFHETLGREDVSRKPRMMEEDGRASVLQPSTNSS